MEKNIKKVCKCEKCGNESEMTITCSLPDSEPAAGTTQSPKSSEHHKVKGTATCSHCGNEADMWIDL